MHRLIPLVLLAACSAQKPAPTVAQPVEREPSPARSQPSEPDATDTNSAVESASAGESCEIEIELLGTEYVGQASGSDQEKLRQQAFERACAAMKAASNVGCDDPDQYSESRVTIARVVKGVLSAEAKVTLRPVLELRKGSASSAEGWQQACLAAVDQACSNVSSDQKCEPSSVSCEVRPGEPTRCRPIQRLPMQGTELLAPAKL